MNESSSNSLPFASTQSSREVTLPLLSRCLAVRRSSTMFSPISRNSALRASIWR